MALRRLFALAGLTALGPISIDLYLPALPALADDLSASASLIQLTVTACMIGLAGGQVVIGAISDRFGRRRPLLVCVFLYVLASAACAAAPSAVALVALRLLQGTAGAAGIVIARAIVRDLYEGPVAARFFALLISVTSLAPVLAPLAGGQLLHVTDWRGIFVVIAALGVVLLVAVFFGIRETLPEEERHGEGVGHMVRVFGRLVSDRRFTGYALAGGLPFAAMFAYIAGSPFSLQEDYGLSPQMFSVVFAINGAGIFVMAQLSGWLASRTDPRLVLRAGLVMSLAGASLLLVSVLGGLGLWGVLPALFLVVSSVGLVVPNSTALALSGYPPGIAGSASALLGLVQFVIGAAASPLVGIAGPESSVPLAVVIAVLSSLAVVAFASTSRTREAVAT